MSRFLSESPARERTHRVYVGSVAVGGGAPVSVQSMTTTDTADAAATLAQIQRLVDSGCEIVRCAVPSSAVLGGFEEICALSPIPVVADIHFDHKLALSAIKRGAAAVRINPGNLGSHQAFDAVMDAAHEAGIPVRIGVNAGSLASEPAEQSEHALVQSMVSSARSFVEHSEARGFTDVVLSAKAHDVVTTVQVYRMLSKEFPHIPLHLGVTEAGTLMRATVKSALALGTLLAEGIGDTVRVSLTEDPKDEPLVAWEILANVRLRRRTPELISCPMCGRCQVALIDIVHEVSERLANVVKPISVAVMGCVVNGPGEARRADVGVACGKGKAVLFRKGTICRHIDESAIVDELFQEIETL